PAAPPTSPRARARRGPPAVPRRQAAAEPGGVGRLRRRGARRPRAQVARPSLRAGGASDGRARLLAPGRHPDRARRLPPPRSEHSPRPLPRIHPLAPASRALIGAAPFKKTAPRSTRSTRRNSGSSDGARVRDHRPEESPCAPWCNCFGSDEFDFVGFAGEDLLRAGVTDAADGDLEVQPLAGQRVVQVDQHGILADLADSDRVALAAGGARVQTQAGFQIGVDGEQRARERDDVVLLARAVGVLARDAAGRLLAFAQAFQSALQRAQDLAAAVQVLDGIFSQARLDHLAAAEPHQIFQRDHAPFLYAHVTSTLRTWTRAGERGTRALRRSGGLRSAGLREEK